MYLLGFVSGILFTLIAIWYSFSSKNNDTTPDDDGDIRSFYG